MNEPTRKEEFEKDLNHLIHIVELYWDGFAPMKAKHVTVENFIEKWGPADGV